MSAVTDKVELSDPCVCGRKRESLHATNWQRHLESCSRKRKLEIALGTKLRPITNYFKAKKRKETAVNESELSTELSTKSAQLTDTDNCSLEIKNENHPLPEIIPENNVLPVGEEALPVVSASDPELSDEFYESIPTCSGQKLKVANADIRREEAQVSLLNQLECNLSTADHTGTGNSEYAELDGAAEWIEDFDRCDNISVEETMDEIDIEERFAYADDVSEPPEIKNIYLYDNDPARLKSLSDLTPEMVDYFLRLGPCQPGAAALPGKKFPVDKLHRSMNADWYKKVLADGSVGVRDWLSYSVEEDKLYCLHCMLFGNKEERLKFWTQLGFNQYKNGVHEIANHENSNRHMECSIKAELRKSGVGALESLRTSEESEIALNREIARQIAEITLYLGRHCLPFRGHRESWCEKIRGNFLDLALLISTFSPDLATHITNLQQPGNSDLSFVSWRRQNLMIQAIGSVIRSKVLMEIRNSPFFSISIDSTFDTSCKEQTSFICRYFDEDVGCVRERFVALRETICTTGQALSKEFTEVMETLSLDWKRFLVAQSYDGANNKRGQYNGLQKLVQDDSPQVLYVWCWAHRLNLVVTDAVSACTDAMDLFGNIERVYDIICSSKVRVANFEMYQMFYTPEFRTKRLQRVGTTRRMSHSYALNNILDSFDAIIATLENVRKHGDDRKAGSEAGGLIDYLLSKRFLYPAFIFQELFRVLQPANAMLQSPDLDFADGLSIVKQSIEDIRKTRSDSTFLNVTTKVNKFIADHSEEEEENKFAPLPNTWPKRKRRLPKQVAVDEPKACPLTKMKVETFFYTIDTVVGQLEERFNCKSNEVLLDLTLMTRRRLLEIASGIETVPKDAFKAICEQYPNFLNNDPVLSEYQQFAKCFPQFDKQNKSPQQQHLNVVFGFGDEEENGAVDDEDVDYCALDLEGHSPMNSRSLIDVMQIFRVNNLKTVFPNLYMLIKIGVTIPVTSCSVKRTFSKLKIIKNRLRSTMDEGRLEFLMMIACENDVEIDVNDVIDKFALDEGGQLVMALLF